jgi:hypothetical protein
LQQIGNKVTVWRDKNRNHVNDDDIVQSGYFGINLHHGFNSKKVGKNSAGCQVIQSRDKFMLFMDNCVKSKLKKFDYLLVNINDIDEILISEAIT